MNQEIELLDLLNKFRRMQKENEVLEFKEAKTQYDFTKLGCYFSALSNEANLHNKAVAWLILGVSDKQVDGIRPVTGTNYRLGNYDGLKKEVADKTNGRFTFRNIHEVECEGKRVLMFEIPASENGIPVTFDGQFYGRDGESLVALSFDKIEAIRRKSSDWSREIVTNATIDDLDKSAIQKAREQFINKNSAKEEVVKFINKLSDSEFLEHIRLTIKGAITNAALLLLGKESSLSLMTIGQPHITWVLVDSNGAKKDYEHFYPPFITVVDRIKGRIRNLKYRYMVGQQSLFPQEVWQYDDWVLREIINNCIAHQDYRLGGNVRVTEYEDKIEFLNSGYFIPETIEAVVLQDFIPPTNRNQCLVSAMCEVNMIDSITSGIQRIYQIQRKKGFPLPTYTLKDGQVKVTIDGKILNENYTKLLFSQADLDLDTVFLLDKVQKNIKIAKEDSDILHKKGLVEGRYPHLFVASEIAEQVDQKQDYIKNKAFDNKYYKDFIYEYFKRYKKATFNEIFKLVEGKMSDVLNKEQKIRKTKYLLTRLKDEGKIRVEGNTKTAVWVLSK
jgi:ATP-dependent DNA helicase RecG